MSPPVIMQRVALGSHCALIVAVVLHDPGLLSLSLAAILLAPLPGLLRARTYTAAWASMLVAFYVAGYLAEGYAQPDTRVGSFLVASIAALDYLSLMMFVRFRGREAAAIRASAPAAETAPSDDAAR
ncbi:DUF2069 domain-containing protein [Panacagrimonas sp.]|uniref:DUF2069 domain-containing protein n=1 Tax=Panacagrimonas sp. TaxID=2480088 RepID=UPI003B52A4D4